MAVGMVDHLNDVVAAAGGRKPRELTAVRRRSSRHRRGRRGRGTVGKGAGLSRNGNATQTQQQDGASGEVRGARSLEQRRQHGAAGAEQCPDLFHLWLSHREYGPGDWPGPPLFGYVLGFAAFREVLESRQVEVDPLLYPVRTLAGLFQAITVVAQLQANLGSALVAGLEERGARLGIA